MTGTHRAACSAFGLKRLAKLRFGAFALTLWMGACSETKTRERAYAANDEAGTAADASASSACPQTRVVSARVIVESRADLAALHCVREVSGLLSISGADITELIELEHLERAEGLDLHDTQLADLSGLRKLSELGDGGLRIVQNPKLRALYGLEALQRVSGAVEIEHNAHLQTLSGLSALEAVSSPPGASPHTRRIVIRHNPELTSLAALSSLASVPGGLHVCGNAALVELPSTGPIVGSGLVLNVLYNASLDAEAVRAFADVIQADIHSKFAANGLRSYVAPATCPFRGDRQCDESSVVLGHVIETCEAPPCCEPSGPTKLCADGTDDPADCPQEAEPLD